MFSDSVLVANHYEQSGGSWDHASIFQIHADHYSPYRYKYTYYPQQNQVCRGNAPCPSTQFGIIDDLDRSLDLWKVYAGFLPTLQVAICVWLGDVV
jgi:hypothetical protein